MPELSCTVRRIGDYASRTEEYEMSFAVGDARPHGLRIKYQAARAYEINAALDADSKDRPMKLSPSLRGGLYKPPSTKREHPGPHT